MTIYRTNSQDLKGDLTKLIKLNLYKIFNSKYGNVKVRDRGKCNPFYLQISEMKNRNKLNILDT